MVSLLIYDLTVLFTTMFRLKEISNAVLICSVRDLINAKILNKCSIGTAALMNVFVPNAAVISGRHLFGRGAYSNKLGKSLVMLIKTKIYEDTCLKLLASLKSPLNMKRYLPS